MRKGGEDLKKFLSAVVQGSVVRVGVLRWSCAASLFFSHSACSCVTAARYSVQQYSEGMGLVTLLEYEGRIYPSETSYCVLVGFVLRAMDSRVTA